MTTNVLWALCATCGTWLVTALGAATVVFFKAPRVKVMNIMLGFASGVMIAASFWSLLQPAVQRAEAMGGVPAYITATTGFLTGAVFMWLCDKTVSLAQCCAKSNRVMMLLLSITLHNIPEGLAVGVAFGALQKGDVDAFIGAVTVAVGIGLQNFPEGAAVSLPLRREGNSRTKSFLLGQASGMVEPPSGVIGALLVSRTEAVLPFMLSFAAGAMILVAVHELIPECQSERGGCPYLSTMGIVCGFALMTLLDVMLG